jgi:hypothetical protein
LFKTQDYSRKAMLFNSCEVPKNTRREINGLNGDHSGPELVSPNHTKLIHRQKARELRGNLGTQNSNLLFNINVLDAGGETGIRTLGRLAPTTVFETVQ